MERFRIYTENHSHLTALASLRFRGFTILTGHGFYNGQKEDCAVIEILGRPEDLSEVKELAREILRACDQQEVLVTWETIKMKSINRNRP